MPAEDPGGDPDSSSGGWEEEGYSDCSSSVDSQLVRRVGFMQHDAATARDRLFARP